jgi:diguanylate cyclase (GGDEF)-like protein
VVESSDVRLSRRLPIAVRLLAAVCVPLVTLVGVLVIVVNDAQRDGTEARAELARLHLVRGMTALQSAAVQPELVKYLSATEKPDPLTPLQAQLSELTWTRFADLTRQGVTAYRDAARTYPGVMPPGGAEAFEAEIAVLLPALDGDADALRRLPDARYRADAAMGQLFQSFTTDSWLVYRTFTELNRAAVSESAAAVTTLAGTPVATPEVLATLVGVRENAIKNVQFAVPPQIHARIQGVLDGTDYARYEQAVQDSMDVAAGTRAALPPVELLGVVSASMSLLGEITTIHAEYGSFIFDEKEGVVADATARLRNALVLAALVVVLSVALAGGVVRTVTRPLRDLTRRAAELGEGRLDGAPVDTRGTDELARLGRALEGSAATLRHVDAQAEAMADGRLDDPALDRPAPGALGEALHRNVLAVRGLAARLRHDADHDPLTGLLNRAGLEREMAEAPADGSQWLLYLDLDGFKPVNDTYGHQAGDEVLRAVAQRLQAAVRPDDLVARLGGDEFLVVITGGEIGTTAQRLAGVVRQPIRLRGTDRGPAGGTAATVLVGVSIGCAELNPGVTLADALGTADAEMYVAKQAARLTNPG